MSVVVPSTVVMSGRAPAARRLLTISPVESGVFHPILGRPGPGFVAKAATHSGVAPAISPVPVANVSYAPFRTKPWCITPEAVIRALGSAPRASRAFTSGSLSLSVSRPPRPRAPPCLRLHALSHSPTGAAAACSAVTPSTAPFASAPCSSRKCANALCPAMTAKASGCAPSDPLSSTRAPAASSTSAVSMSPLRAAAINGENRCRCRGCTSAPCSTSARTTSRWRSATAHISAVSSVAAVAASMSPPRASRSLTTSRLPVRAAVMSGVSPFVCAAFGSAPASSSRSTTAALAFSHARARGVTP